MEIKKRKRQVLTEEQKLAKNAYHLQYGKDRIKKRVIDFNVGSDEDMKILNHLDEKPNKSRYVKGLIKEDMVKAGE